MTDGRCIICGETEEGNESHDLTPTDAHGFLPLSKLWKPIDDEIKASQQEVLLGWFTSFGFDGQNDPAPMYDVGFWHSREKAWCNTHRVLHNQHSHPTHYMPLPAPAIKLNRGL